ncbi:hypothetical protein HYH02_010190 [Chlamydomonas schloesseri]|uniref:Uncharacterized protein n=1 Tax=Chlamydomonas schloesseri TaxID=2026947 RepID=A0A835TAR8_9CHLO|nr:hypothetical protein HYH02_010190 [Chlamydomonas schloesseri]|eukprot:KAG2440611.1 hypothetical protein HYH02_010190 [Chlamydomonas schloesseri]
MAPTFSCTARQGASASTPQLTGAAPSRHYRRSTTTKAPRKRTFLVGMTRFDARVVAGAGLASSACGAAGSNTLGSSCQLLSCGGDDNSGRFNINNFGGNGGNNGGSNGGFGFSGDFGMPESRFGRALIGAFALTALVAAFPEQSRAMLGSSSTSPSVSPNSGAMLLSASRAEVSPSRSSRGSSGRSKVVHVMGRDSTLVVPITDSQLLSRSPATGGFLSGGGRVRIVDAPIELSPSEVSMIAEKQYRVRESMRVN